VFKPDLLKGKRILITGGGTGLGKEIAAKYVELGAELNPRRRHPRRRRGGRHGAAHLG
jgi:NAD(P)-dependent dehydrogenase (short-subunit alcohol dehydrogenase family)